MTEDARGGSFALVSYVPDPLGSFLHDLQKTLCGDFGPKAHITILPPRPLKGSIEEASLAIRKIVDRFVPFDIELEGVRRFDETNSLYLELGDGSASVYELHDALNTDDLQHAEEFEFRPHLTLSHPKTEMQWTAAQDLAQSIWSSAECSRRFRVDEVVFLWLSPGSSQREWRRIWTHPLNRASAASSGRI